MATTQSQIVSMVGQAIKDALSRGYDNAVFALELIGDTSITVTVAEVIDYLKRVKP